MAYRLTDEQRELLARPWGPVLREQELEVLLRGLSPDQVVAVGDVTNRQLMDLGFYPKVQIVDNRVMRRDVAPLKGVADEAVRVKNPPSHITQEALGALRRALRKEGSVRIIVEGEEDLLALASIAELPEGWVVLYGQPGRGVVVVRIDDEVKARARAIIASMPRVRL
jgi:uncharacterized protein (UPF0218 family)